LVPFGCGFPFLFRCLGGGGGRGAARGFAHCGAVTRDVVVGGSSLAREGVGISAAHGTAIGSTCGCVWVWCILHVLYDLHLFPCAVPSVCNYNFWSECVLGWVGLGRGIATSSLCSALSLSLSSALSLVRNRHCETSSIGWGAQCRRVGGGCSDFGHCILFPSRYGCVCLSVIVFGRRCACPLFRSLQGRGTARRRMQ
jgi:hypothetical protein